MAAQAQKRIDTIEQVKAAIKSNAIQPEQALELANDLKNSGEFGYAWRLLNHVRASKEVKHGSDMDIRFLQQIALCTYKDTHLNDEHRLVRALEILGEGDHLATSDDPETLGLAGAIHKRLWKIRNDKSQLEIALRYYRRGHEHDKKQSFANHKGYPGINAAFILDLLASFDRETSESAPAIRNLISARYKESEDIRTQIVAGLDPLLSGKKESPRPNDYWALATMAEAQFGLGNFDDAEEWLAVAVKLKEEVPWEFESTARQLTDLARLLEFDGTKSADDFAESAAGKVLLSFLGDNVAGLKTAYVGKVGLSLSGGGFRASLFHIGVLARLAELDVLRHIEALSCVSGGSIVGAHYYLELRHLLQTKLDKDITRQDYIELVKRLQAGFLKGVQTNIRMRIAAEWTTNLKMIFLPGYSRTHRLGELYEKKLYDEVQDGEAGAPRYISDLYVLPRDSQDEGRFNPRRQNWSRANKVPILILNATSLNTGHNWQFTASWMGEPPTTVNPEIDSNYRLRRLYYGDAPEEFKKVRLGTAVAASSCVPGLFEPVALKDLYEHRPTTNNKQVSLATKDKITVRLVDGGVHDNQGVVGLIEQDCDVMLVSDASGQMEAMNDPSNSILGVPLRSNSILMSRVRDSEYEDLMSRIRSNELRDLMFIHMKMDLRVDPVDWVGSKEPTQSAAATEVTDLQGDMTRYGINRRVQRLLANNRTDLDSWSDVEAFALMLSGYRMTEYQFPRSVDTVPTSSEPPADPGWDFLSTDRLQHEAVDDSLFMRVLEVGSRVALKVWFLSRPLRVIGVLITIAVVVFVAYFAWENRSQPLLTVKGVGIFILILVVTVLFGKLVMKIVWIEQTLAKIAFGIGMSLFGFLISRLHLHVFDRIYLYLGRIERANDSEISAN